MTETGENPEVEDKESLDYIKIKELPLPELVRKFNHFTTKQKVEFVNNYCLGRCFSEHEDNKINENIKLEYLKEFGRNARTMIKNDDSDDPGEDEGLFPRHD